jgi:hypothetical protein
VPQERLVEMEANGSLARYSLLVLPDLGELTSDTAQTVDGFVASGGRLLATGATALAQDGTVQLASLAAERRLAATTTADLLWSTYVAPEHAVNGDPHTYAGPIVPVYGAYHYCAWRPEAQQRFGLLARAPFGPPEKAYGHVQVNHPGYVLWSHGRGRSATIPWTIGRAFHDLGLTVERELVISLVHDLLDGAEPVSVDVPEQVEVTVHTTGERTVVHLVNLSGARRKSFGPPVPIRGGTLRIAGAGTGASAHALFSDSPCTVKADADGISVVLPEIGLFEVIVVGKSEEVAQ